MVTDMDINTLRGQFINSSTNNSRESSTHSSVLLITYDKRVKALNNSSFWADQVEVSKSQGLTLSYTNLEMGENNKANEATVIINIPEPHKMNANNKNMNTC